MIDPRYDNVEVYHGTQYGLALKRVLAGRELLTEALLPGFQMPLHELFAGNATLPGSAASLMLSVSETTTTVRIALALKWSSETMTTGLRYPGSEPRGSGKSAHQISPRFNRPTPRVARSPLRRRRRTDRPHRPRLPTPG